MMKKEIILGLSLALAGTSGMAQVGIGTTNPDVSAALEVYSTTKGILPPRMTHAQMSVISNPATGLLLFCTDCSPAGIYSYNGTVYISLTSETEPTSNTGLGSSLTTVGVNGVAFSTNSTCSGKIISATECTTAETTYGIGSDPDGGGYTVVEIGDATSGYKQCWMAENIQDGSGPPKVWANSIDNGWYGYLSDGDQTPNTPPTTDGDGTTGSALAYNEKEGFVYQWSAAMNGATAERNQGICPTGWHIPSDCEWMFLENNLGMSISAQETNSAWRGTNEGTKLKEGGSSNFEGVLAGSRSTNGSFSNRGANAYYWSSSTSGSSVYRRSLNTSLATVYRNTGSKGYARSVRCLKD